jgi:hypothetical protein
MSPRARLAPSGEETTVLTVKVPTELLRRLDEETRIMSSEQKAGRLSMSRGELVRVVLNEWLDARDAARASVRTKPRA